jgi:hypothetical protein
VGVIARIDSVREAANRGKATEANNYPDVNVPCNDYPDYPDYQGNRRAVVATERCPGEVRIRPVF